MVALLLASTPISAEPLRVTGATSVCESSDPKEIVVCGSREHDHRYLVFTIDSDVCFYPDEQSHLCRALRGAGVRHQHITVHSEKGHDSFLIEPELYAPNITYLLEHELKQ